jgi:hypothetical protein
MPYSKRSVVSRWCRGWLVQQLVRQLLRLLPASSVVQLCLPGEMSVSIVLRYENRRSMRLDL